jgi:hypothetical protein
METLSRHGDPLHPGLVFPVGSVDSLVAANGASIAPARRARRALDEEGDLMVGLSKCGFVKVQKKDKKGNKIQFGSRG